MQKVFKAIANKISAQYNKTNLCAGVQCFQNWAERSGRKLAKAQELAIKILSPDEFFRMAGEGA